MTPRPPDDVDWLDDGFAIELGRLRRGVVTDRNRHVWALTAPLYLLALGVELTIAGSAFVVGIALVLFARQAMWFDERKLTVGSWDVQVGRRRIRASALDTCDLRGNSLVVRTHHGTWALCVGGLAEPEQHWLRDEIRAVARRWRARDGKVPEALQKVASTAV
ncbi:MAG: hypothetical protein AAF602_11035 [Myxococcota bacterium]